MSPRSIVNLWIFQGVRMSISAIALGIFDEAMFLLLCTLRYEKTEGCRGDVDESVRDVEGSQTVCAAYRYQVLVRIGLKRSILVDGKGTGRE
jgi:hypothetical protein